MRFGSCWLKSEQLEHSNYWAYNITEQSVCFDSHLHLFIIICDMRSSCSLVVLIVTSSWALCDSWAHRSRHISSSKVLHDLLSITTIWFPYVDWSNSDDDVTKTVQRTETWSSSKELVFVVDSGSQWKKKDFWDPWCFFVCFLPFRVYNVKPTQPHKQKLLSPTENTAPEKPHQ